MPILTEKTRAYRHDLMQKLMQRQRVDALIFTSADFFQWATNFHVDVQTWERPIAVCVPLSGEPFAIMNELSTHHVMMARERGHLWLDDISFYSEHPRVVERQPLLAEVPELIAARLRAAGSVFLGDWSPESAGDYASGTNHVLPTYGYTATCSSLGLADFQN